MIAGSATGEGTARFAKESGIPQENYKNAAGLTLSNVGIGTYLGEPDSQTDAQVIDAIKRSVAAGINVIDTAINYRAQRAERAVGGAISEMVADGAVSRDQIFVATKNGYVTNDAEIPGDFWGYINKEYIQKGIIQEGEISAGYHCMAIPYLEDQLGRSLKNLSLECIDLIYIHNAMEGQKDMPRGEFLERLARVFEMYERKRKEGVIRSYGMATWECLRVARDNPQYLSLEELVGMAQSAGGGDHGFGFVQLPFNLYYDQAMMLKNQPVGGAESSVLEAAAKLGIGVFTSVPFMQGRLLQPGAMPEFSDHSPAVRALQFIRSAPGVLAPLAGQKTREHTEENLAVMNIPPVPQDEFAKMVAKLTHG